MTIATDACADIPFDQYQRYRLVADVLQRIREDANGGKPLRVLDVGGRTALLRRFLPEDHVFLVDVEASEEEGLVLGDGSKLPYKDGSFDAVATFDTLEHVPPAGREAFLAECSRVTRGWVVVAGPYDTPRVADAEIELREFLTHKLETKHRYLDEHHENGLPSLDGTESKLRELGANVHSVAHGNIDRWLAMMCLSFYMDRDAPLRGIAARFHRFYNESLYSSDHAAPVYRHAVVASFNGQDPGAIAPQFDLPVAPPEAMERVRHFANELLLFDAKRDVFEKERERLTAVNDGLVTDLDQHKTKLQKLEELYEERGAVLAELRADVADYEAGLAKLRRESEESTRTSDATIETLRADLTGHADVIEDLNQELANAHENAQANVAGYENVLAELRSEIESHVTIQAELRSGIDAHEAQAEVQRRELEEVNRVATEVQSSLVELQAARVAQDETVVELRGEIDRRGEALESHSATIAELDSERSRLGDELVKTQEGLAQTQGELVAERAASAEAARAAEQEREALEAEIASQREQLAQLREVANSRVKSLGRAFALKKRRL